MTTVTPEDGTLQRLLEDEIEPFLEHLRAARYADETVHRKRAIAVEFAADDVIRHCQRFLSIIHTPTAPLSYSFRTGSDRNASLRSELFKFKVLVARKPIVSPHACVGGRLWTMWLPVKRSARGRERPVTERRSPSQQFSKDGQPSITRW
jgi:hypothetical protein